MTCTRAAHARWSACECPPCRANRLRLQKQRRTGRFIPARSTEAWAVIDRLFAAGWTPAAVASAAGVPARAVQAALARRRAHGTHTWSQVYADRFLTMTAPAKAGYLPVLGARRRLRALARIGWSVYAIEGTMPVHVKASTMFAIRSGLNTDRITPAVDAAVRNAYDVLHMRPAPPGRGATAAKAKAHREGWAAPLDFDDIDDPNDVPDTTDSGLDVDPIVVERLTAGKRCAHTNAERLAAIERLHNAGATLNAIADLLHTGPKQVTRGLHDLGLTRQNVA